MPPPIKEFVLNDEQRELIENNMGLLYKCFHRLKGKYHFLDETEVWDACTEAAVTTAYNLDKEKGKYSTLLFVAANRNALKRVRYHDYGCRKGSKFDFSIDFMSGNRSGDRVSSADEKEDMLERYLGVEDNHDFIDKDVVDRVFSVLDQREKMIMYKFVIEEKQRKDIAKEIGLSPQQTGRLIILAKEKIKEKMEGTG